MGAHQTLPSAEEHLCFECTHEEFCQVIAEHIDDPKAELSLHPFSAEAAEDGDDAGALLLEDAHWESDGDWQPRESQDARPSSRERSLEAVSREMEQQQLAVKLQDARPSSREGSLETVSREMEHQQLAVKLQDPGRVAALMAIGQSRRVCGDLDGALQSIEMALVTHKSTSAAGLRLRLALINSKGALLHSQGRAELALEAYKKAYSLCQALGLVGRLHEAVLLLNMGMAHMLAADFETAASHFSMALKVREKRKAMCTPSGIKLLERIGDLKLETGHFNSAFEKYATALGNCQSMDTLERVEGARLLSKMGTVDRMQRHFKAALQKYTHSASILLRAKANNIVAFAKLQGDIGIVRRELGELDSARQAFEKAVAIRHETDTLNSFEGMLLLMNMGTTLRLVEDFQGALDKYSQAREIRQQMGTSTPVPSDVHLLLQISTAAYKLDDQQWATEAFLEAQRIRKEINMPQTPEGRSVLKLISSGLLVSTVRAPCWELDDVEISTDDGSSHMSHMILGPLLEEDEEDIESEELLSPASTATTISC